MRRILTIALISAAAVACAPAYAFNDEIIETCAGYGETARMAYRGYAAHIPMHEQIELAGDSQDIIEIVLAAYQEPLMFTADMIEDQAGQFGNEIEASCFAYYAQFLTE